MKGFLIALLSTTMFVSVSAQSNFTIERTDSASMVKTQIYDNTKKFIKEFWNTDNVIKNDDKESNTILVKGLIYRTVSFIYDRKYVYSYTAKFAIKDKTYKIVIGKIECESAISSIDNSIPYVDFCDGCKYPGNSATKMPKGKWKDLMSSIKTELNNVADSYVKSMKL